MKFVAAALAGATSAALSPLPGDSAAFPVFDTLDSPSGTDVVATLIMPAYSTVDSALIGTVRGYRNGLYIFPTQAVTQFTTGQVGNSVVKAQTTTHRSFWTHDVAYVGLYPANTAANSALPTNAEQIPSALSSFNLCSAINVYTECYGGRAYNKDNTDVTSITQRDQWITNRTVAKANTRVFTDDPNFYQFQFNEDIGLAAQFHSAWADDTAVITGAKWCGKWKSTLAIDGTVQASNVTKGFTGKNKCTFMYVSADATVGPTFKIKETTKVDILLQWIEFIDGQLGTGGVMAPLDTAAEYFQGVYTATDGPFLNPFVRFAAAETDVTNSKSMTEWTYYNSPVNWGAGSVGRARYHTEDAGNLSDYTTSTGDIQIFWDFQGFKKSEFDQFNTDKAAYEEQKEIYVTALADRDAQLKDIFKQMFEPVVEIPDRPENIMSPDAYMGPTIDLSKYIAPTSKTWKVLASANDGNSALVTSLDFDAVPATTDVFANKIGYLVASNDATDATQDVGHVFGRLGQGTATMPANAKPLLWGVTTAKIGHMLVSVYPNTATDAGITDATKHTVIEACAKTWADLSEENLPPSKPAETSGAAPQQGAMEEGAKTLAVGVAGALAIVSSLF